MKLYLPECLDIDAHIKQFPPVDFDDFEKDKLVYFLSLILSVPANNKEIAEEECGWVSLYSRILSRTDRKYWMYFKYALGEMYPGEEDAKIIQTDKQYIVGKKSIAFAFVEKYAKNCGLTSVEIGGKLSLKLKKEAEAKRKLALKQYPNLLRWFDVEKLKIDAEAARKYATYLRDQAIAEQEDLKQKEVGKVKTSIPKKKPLPNPKTQYLSYMVNIDRIEKGDYFISVDDNVKRLHTNLTNLKSELRNFLTYDGKRLVSVDIKNCQPFLSIALFNPRFYAKTSNVSKECLEEKTTQSVVKTLKDIKKRGNRFTLESVAHEISCELENGPISFIPKRIPLPLALKRKREAKFGTSLLDSLIMYVNAMQLSNNEDVTFYKETVANGSFYEKSKELIEQKTEFRFSSRKEVKQMMFLVLFTDNRFYGGEDAEPKRLFAEVYPTVYEFFSLIKTKDKSVLPRLLQSIESWLVLDKVCARIYKERPELPIFTIHDSIVTTEGNEAYVEQVMVEEIEKFIKAKPAVDVERYYPEKLQATGVL